MKSEWRKCNQTHFDSVQVFVGRGRTFKEGRIHALSFDQGL